MGEQHPTSKPTVTIYPIGDRHTIPITIGTDLTPRERFSKTMFEPKVKPNRKQRRAKKK